MNADAVEIKVPGFENGVVDPETAQHGLSVEVTISPSKPVERLDVRWGATVGGSEVDYSIGTEVFNTPGTTHTVEITPKNIAASLGLDVKVTATLFYEDGTEVSNDLFFQVGHFSASALPAPWITQADENRVLDVSEVTVGTIRLGRFPFWDITLGYVVWLYAKGKTAEGVEHDHRLWVPESNKMLASEIERGYLEKSLPYSYLKELGAGTKLDIHFLIYMRGASTTFDKQAEALAMPVSTYTIANGAEFIEERESFDDLNILPWYAGSAGSPNDIVDGVFRKIAKDEANNGKAGIVLQQTIDTLIPGDYVFSFDVRNIAADDEPLSPDLTVILEGNNRQIIIPATKVLKEQGWVTLTGNFTVSTALRFYNLNITNMQDEGHVGPGGGNHFELDNVVFLRPKFS